ncbi:Fe(3+) dicitrate ABC transporter substrate-binding protein FecB [Pseudomonas cichorii]|uniref:Fe(3+) dicitrate ABC transporter substrate-binding protein FecB n=1 Tax=Pseudomonas lijiangensis TaxID=2995658 RepID=A0ABX8HT78_9PSED|nr:MULTISPECIES: Fe(3+) dicitrate ABC transporter substrate-binding protein FecB [Pseudomonas syringae group]MBX8491266.1 Fe(3+) dicitrate ABC transporter substrate-binding protein FecB [Pseudomonas cichorii]MBX8500846.1 Fe(3+) dicitrate ABC transporter substrate-binding protein FecB [Pseudomonas lijiangensis]MBX8505845.1 Fe(3+) dicitrate ABC transporter substrate-binding protein FecB [Pseudomonas lijiangensis]MBX8510511.1 Fe(3+) dicitrate ABC transporter substrate-binding protein FecB [Pseudom
MRTSRLSRLLACGLLALSASVAQAAPIDIDDGQHKVHLPDAPKRVVVLEFSFLDGLASVGVTPVGAADDGDANRVLPKVRKAVGEWQSVGLRSQPNIEVIARLKPDLIIADLGRHQALYNDLASLAPTLMLPSRGEDYEGSLKSAELIGVALGKGPQMQARIAENRKHLKDIAAQIPANTKALFGVAREDSFSVHGPHSYAGSVLQAIGLQVPEVRKNAAPTEFVSLEQLLALDPGWLLVGHYRRPSLVDTWSKQPLWQVLGAVRNKQVAEVDGDSWARNRGIMASEQIADDTLAILKGGKAVLNP